MKVAALTRYKQGDLYNALQQLGWTQTRLAQEIGCNTSTVGLIINLKQKPTVELANKIQAVFGEHDIYIDVTALWPDTFQPLKTNLRVQVAEVEMLSLEQTEVMLLEDDQTPVLDNERKQIIEAALATLTSRQREVVKMVIYDKLSFMEIGRRLNTGRGTPQQTYRRALRRLAWNGKANNLRNVLDFSPGVEWSYNFKRGTNETDETNTD